MKNQDKIREIVLHYVKIQYNNYLDEQNIQFIDENKLSEIITELYYKKKDDLKIYIKSCLNNEGSLLNHLTENIIFEIFEDEELCINRLILEVQQYQSYKKQHSKHYKNCYDIQLTPDNNYGLGLELAIVNDNVEILGF